MASAGRSVAHEVVVEEGVRLAVGDGGHAGGIGGELAARAGTAAGALEPARGGGSLGGKSEALLALPLIALGVYLLLTVLPRFDPGRRNYEQFGGAYRLLRLGVLLLLAVVHRVVLAPIYGITPNVNRVVPFASGLLLVLIGATMGKLRPTGSWGSGPPGPSRASAPGRAPTASVAGCSSRPVYWPRRPACSFPVTAPPSSSAPSLRPPPSQSCTPTSSGARILTASPPPAPPPPRTLPTFEFVGSRMDDRTDFPLPVAPAAKRQYP
jgi:hypothetical protein